MVMEKRGEEMAKIGCVDLEEKNIQKDECILNVEPCLKVEELLQSYERKSLGDMGCSFDRLNNRSCLLSAKLCFAITDLKLSETEIEQMLSLEGLKQRRELK